MNPTDRNRRHAPWAAGMRVSVQPGSAAGRSMAGSNGASPGVGRVASRFVVPAPFASIALRPGAL
jgi:hypothetical protein